MGDAAPWRSRAHPRSRARHRELGVDAVEAVGRGEFAGGFGEGVSVVPGERGHLPGVGPRHFPPRCGDHVERLKQALRWIAGIVVLLALAVIGTLAGGKAAFWYTYY